MPQRRRHFWHSLDVRVRLSVSLPIRVILSGCQFPAERFKIFKMASTKDHSHQKLGRSWLPGLGSGTELVQGGTSQLGIELIGLTLKWTGGKSVQGINELTLSWSRSTAGAIFGVEIWQSHAGVAIIGSTN